MATSTSYAKLLGCSLVFALFHPQLSFMKALSQSLEENILHLLRTVVGEDQPDEYAGPQCTREISVPGRRDIWVAALFTVANNLSFSIKLIL